MKFRDSASAWVTCSGSIILLQLALVWYLVPPLVGIQTITAWLSALVSIVASVVGSVEGSVSGPFVASVAGVVATSVAGTVAASVTGTVVDSVLGVVVMLACVLFGSVFCVPASPQAH